MGVFQMIAKNQLKVPDSMQNGHPPEFRRWLIFSLFFNVWTDFYSHLVNEYSTFSFNFLNPSIQTFFSPAISTRRCRMLLGFNDINSAGAEKTRSVEIRPERFVDSGKWTTLAHGGGFGRWFRRGYWTAKWRTVEWSFIIILFFNGPECPKKMPPHTFLHK